MSPAALQFGQGVALDPGPGFALDLNGSFTYKPTEKLQLSLNYNKARLRRYDTGLVAFDDNIYAFRGTYQFTRFLVQRARALTMTRWHRTFAVNSCLAGRLIRAPLFTRATTTI